MSRSQLHAAQPRSQILRARLAARRPAWQAPALPRVSQWRGLGTSPSKGRSASASPPLARVLAERLGRPPGRGAPRGEPVSPRVLPGPEEARVPGAALLPALALPAAAGAVPAGPVQPLDRRRVPLRARPDLRVPDARARTSSRSTTASTSCSGPRVVKPDLVVYLQARTDVLLAPRPPSRARLRALDRRGVARGARQGLQRLLLPLRRDPPPRRQRERHRPRGQSGGRRGAPRGRPEAPEGDAALRATRHANVLESPLSPMGRTPRGGAYTGGFEHVDPERRRRSASRSTSFAG